MVKILSEMVTSRSPLEMPAVRALTTNLSAVSYTSTANCPGKSPGSSSHASGSSSAGSGLGCSSRAETGSESRPSLSRKAAASHLP